MDENQMNPMNPNMNQMPAQPSTAVPAPSPAPQTPPPSWQNGVQSQAPVPSKPLDSAQGKRRGVNKNTWLIVAAIALVVLAGVLVAGKLFVGNMQTDALAKKAVDYINANGLAGQGQTAVLQGASEESGLVKVKLQIGSGTFDSYITKDGKLLFPQAITLSGAGALTGDNTTPPTTTQPADASKVDIAGDPFIGSATAPALMVFWTDYQCPFCKLAEQNAIEPIVGEYVNTGKLKIVFKEYAFLGDDSYTLAKWSQAVWEAAPAKYYAWHKHIFENQGQEHSGWATETKIMELSAQALGAA